MNLDSLKRNFSIRIVTKWKKENFLYSENQVPYDKAMKYLETSQIIPNKGMSYTMYEVEGEDKIVRMLTTIPDTGEIHLYPKPPVKKLYKPELCRSVEPNEFLGLWAMGEEQAKAKQEGN